MAKDTKLVTPGQMICVLRKMHGLSQKELAEKANMSMTNITAMEKDRQHVGKKVAVSLGKALGVHPAVILFSDYKP